MKTKILSILLFVLLPSSAPVLANSFSEDKEQVTIEFVEGETAAKLLKRRDAFVKALSLFDRQVRMKKDADIQEEEFLNYIGEQVVEWSDDEKTKVSKVIAVLNEKLERYNISFSEVVYFVKTTGKEEAGSGYCREQVIVLKEDALKMGDTSLLGLVAHELFHIVSQNNVETREALYAIIGFKVCNEIALPMEMEDYKITNPDAVWNKYFIEVTYEGKKVKAVPVLFSKRKYDPASKGGLFAYLNFQMMVIEEDRNEKGMFVCKYVEGKPVLFSPDKTEDYFKQIGKNTGYIIHPEEILADNFVILVLDQKARSPEIIEKMKDILMENSEED